MADNHDAQQWERIWISDTGVVRELNRIAAGEVVAQDAGAHRLTLKDIGRSAG
ncbi:MAG TPA: hypothetical protein VKT27_10645 [Candidatus Binataceae bacterium]|nr:hypothetical protein [Candidatus Binataceae bacterium]